MSIRPKAELLALPLALAAGVLALGGVVYEAGLRPLWLERWRVEWMTPSDRLAERAYRAFLAGQTRQGLARFEDAVNRNPASPYRWCDYGEALLSGREGGTGGGVDAARSRTGAICRSHSDAWSKFRLPHPRSKIASGPVAGCSPSSRATTRACLQRGTHGSAGSGVGRKRPAGRPAAQSYLRFYWQPDRWTMPPRPGRGSSGAVTPAICSPMNMRACSCVPGSREPRSRLGEPTRARASRDIGRERSVQRQLRARASRAGVRLADRYGDGFSAERDPTVAAAGQFSLRLSFAGTGTSSFNTFRKPISVGRAPGDLRRG